MIVSSLKISLALGFFLGIFGFVVFPVFSQPANQTAIVGQVSKLSTGTISIVQKTDDLVDLTTNAQTTVYGPKGSLTISQIKAGDIIGAIATSSGAATPSARKLARKVFVGEASPSADAAKRIIIGVVTGINDSEITLLEKKEVETFYTMSASASAIVKGRGNMPIDFESIALGQRIIAVGRVTESTLVPQLIHVIASE